jgi:hypothetical protein
MKDKIWDLSVEQLKELEKAMTVNDKLDCLTKFKNLIT